MSQLRRVFSGLAQSCTKPTMVPTPPLASTRFLMVLTRSSGVPMVEAAPSAKAVRSELIHLSIRAIRLPLHLPLDPRYWPCSVEITRVLSLKNYLAPSRSSWRRHRQFLSLVCTHSLPCRAWSTVYQVALRHENPGLRRPRPRRSLIKGNRFRVMADGVASTVDQEEVFLCFSISLFFIMSHVPDLYLFYWLSFVSLFGVIVTLLVLHY